VVANVNVSVLGIDKLIEVCAQGVSALLKPWMVKRVARAEAEKMKVLAAAQHEIDERSESLKSLRLGPGEPLELSQESVTARVEARIAHREGRRLLNVESIALGAADALAEESTVSSDPVDEDWIARFFGAAQEVSSRDLQSIWSRLLACEVAMPGAVSMRTLDVLRNLCTSEARLFAEMLALVCSDATCSGYFFPRVPGFMRNVPVLEEAGLIGTHVMWSSRAVDDVFIWKHAGYEMRFAAREDKTLMGLSWKADAYRLTSAGESIVRVSTLPIIPSRQMLVELNEELSKYFDIQVVVDDEAVTLATFLNVRNVDVSRTR
jgi:hypothetical protein